MEPQQSAQPEDGKKPKANDNGRRSPSVLDVLQRAETKSRAGLSPLAPLKSASGRPMNLSIDSAASGVTPVWERPSPLSTGSKPASPASEQNSPWPSSHTALISNSQEDPSSQTQSDSKYVEECEPPTDIPGTPASDANGKRHEVEMEREEKEVSNDHSSPVVQKLPKAPSLPLPEKASPRTERNRSEIKESKESDSHVGRTEAGTNGLSVPRKNSGPASTSGDSDSNKMATLSTYSKDSLSVSSLEETKSVSSLGCEKLGCRRSYTHPDKVYDGLATFLKLDVYNPFRKLMIDIADNKWFERFILATIIANSVLLAMDNPAQAQSDSKRNAFQVFELVSFFVSFSFPPFLPVLILILLQLWCSWLSFWRY